MRIFLRCCLILATGAVGAAAANAQQETWAGLRVPPASSTSNALPLSGNEYIEARCTRVAPGNFTCSDDPSQVRTYFVPIAEFARISTVNALSTRLDATEASWGAQIRATRSNLFHGVALASAFDIRSPAPGLANRFGISGATFEGRTAFALNYTHQEGRYDFGVSMGTSGRYQAGKASAGISW